MLTSIRKVKFTKCMFLKCLSPLFVLLIKLWTYDLEYGGHLARLHRRRRRRAHSPTTDTASHDNYEKTYSWVSFSWGSA